MAFAVKYRYEFTENYNGDDYRVDISEDGFVGSVTTVRPTGNPFVISRPEAGNLFDVIQGSRAVANVYSDSDFDFLEFFDADFASFKVELIRDPDGTPVTEWVGFNEPGQFQEPFIDTPYPVQLAFTDGLAELKNKFFTADGLVDGTEHTGKMHWIQIFRLCLNLTNPLNINVVIGLFADGMTESTATTPANQSYLRSETYKIVDDKVELPMDASSPIKGILESIGCVIYQQDGEWWIVRVAEVQDATLTYLTFAPAVGSESGTSNIGGDAAFDHTIDIVGSSSATASDLVMLDQSTSLLMTDRIRKFHLTYRPNVNGYLNSSFLRNSFFSVGMGFNSDSLPTHFTRSAGLSTAECSGIKVFEDSRLGGEHWYWPEDPQERKKRLAGRIYGTPDQDDGRIAISWDTSSSAFDSAEYIEQTVTNMPITTSDRIQFSTQVQTQLTSGSAVLNLRAEVRLTQNGTSNHWYMTNSGAWNVPQTYIGTNFPGNNSDKKFFRVLRGIANNAVLPFTGPADIRVRIFRPWRSTTAGTFTDMIMYHIAPIYGVDTGTSAPIDEIDYTSLIDSNNQTFDRLAMHGSGPDPISERSFRDTSGVYQYNWNRRGTGENRRTWDIHGQDVLDLYSSNNEQLQGTYRGKLKMFNRVDVVVNSITYSYAVNGFTRDVINRENQVLLTKIDTQSYTSDDYTKNLPTGPIPDGGDLPPPSGGGSSGGSGSGNSEPLQGGGGFNPDFG